MAVIALADYFSKLGVAIYILYMLPVALTFFAWDKKLPLKIALLGTALIIFDFLITPDGLYEDLAQLNRSFGVITLWMLAGVGYQFIQVRLDARRESWMQEGLTKLGFEIAGEKGVEDLGDSVLKVVAKYVDAQAGAMFVRSNGSFHRAATFGASKDSVPEAISAGEGLLGEAARDQQFRILHDIPSGYLSVGSSFGDSPPRNLVIMPMSLEGRVNSIVEFGFFNPVQESDCEFIKRIESAVAVAVRSAKYRDRLEELLAETQQQASELQAQSEELRVSNEELEEQSRALRDSESRLELQQTELEQINTQLEEQTQILERQKNDLLNAKSALESQAEQVEQASRYKSDFLANMSHELRTPLNSSLILAKLLAENGDGNLTEDQVQYARTIESSGKDLLNLINDVLDLSKIEAGHMVINPEQIYLSTIQDNLRSVFEPMASQKGITLTLESQEGIPDTIETDSQRLEQVLKNLLSNALKFTEQGFVSFKILPGPDGRVAFEVKDTGIGISPEKQQTIFDPFFQADGTTARKYGGTGLGLSISQNLIRLLGGEIKLESELEKGSTFTVILPEEYQGELPAGDMPDPFLPTPDRNGDQKQPEPKPKLVVARVPDDRESLSGNSRIILVVEDDESFARIVKDLVHELDFQCLIATSAEEALILAKQYEPSAIVLDVGLPDNSGLMVLEHLKSGSHTRHIPVHVVSASDYSHTALALGAVGYMLKPVQREQLAEALRNLETRLTQRMRRVLVVEDDPVQIRAMKELLGSRDVETVSAQTAAECLEELKDNTFDCMVLDLSLPDASGFSLLETLSTEDAYSFPPVIVYTGRQLDPEEEQQLRRYSKSIIIKGAKSPERLLDEVTLFLHQVVSDLPPEKQRMLEKANSRDATLEGRRILVAEDDVRNVFALTSLLEGRGVKLQIARNGREAIEALERAEEDPGQHVDLVLMDIMMPEMDGLTAMKQIRQRREWARLPIIALTAKAMRNDQEDCLRAGANDYLAKPLDVDKLLSLIRVWMPR